LHPTPFPESGAAARHSSRRRFRNTRYATSDTEEDDDGENDAMRAREDKEEIFERAAPHAGEGVPVEMGEVGEAAQMEHLSETPDAAADDEPPEPPEGDSMDEDDAQGHAPSYKYMCYYITGQ
jgi:hypothetical protein